jgi:hypothetical protein
MRQVARPEASIPERLDVVQIPDGAFFGELHGEGVSTSFQATLGTLASRFLFKYPQQLRHSRIILNFCVES